MTNVQWINFCQPYCPLSLLRISQNLCESKLTFLSKGITWKDSFTKAVYCVGEQLLGRPFASCVRNLRCRVSWKIISWTGSLKKGWSVSQFTPGPISMIGYEPIQMKLHLLFSCMVSCPHIIHISWAPHSHIFYQTMYMLSKHR